MPWNSVPQAESSERGKRIVSNLGKCSRDLTGCGICCKQQALPIQPTEQLEKQKWLSGGKNRIVLGEGGFSTVFLESPRLDPPKQAICAVKRLENFVCSRLPQTEYRKQREVDILEELREREHWHWNNRSQDCNSGYRHIVPYLGIYVKSQHIHIVMEYMAQSDLKHYMGISWREHNTRIAVKQLLSGLQFLHGFGLAHRDLKPLNIFPILSHDRSLLIKIGDFGSAKIASAEYPLITPIGGSWEYQAPEVCNNEKYTHAVDIWSLGALCFTLLTGESFFPDRKTFNNYAFGQECDKKPIPNALRDQGIKSEAAIQLVTSMLQINPENRPSAKDALSHEWFKDPSGVGTLVTPELYKHFEAVLLRDGPVLKRLVIDPSAHPSMSNMNSRWHFLRKHFRVNSSKSKATTG